MNISRAEFTDWYENEPKVCVYCEISEEDLGIFPDRYNKTTTRLTVDCKDNELGYIRENLVLACHRCNTVKSDLFSFWEMLEIGQKYIRPIWEKRMQGKVIE